MARLHWHYDELSTEAKGVNILIESGCLQHVDDAAHRLGTDRMIPRHVFHKLFAGFLTEVNVVKACAVENTKREHLCSLIVKLRLKCLTIVRSLQNLSGTATNP
jgi:hypothetical protein